MNFNIKLKVDKVMKIIAESKAFRIWTYSKAFRIWTYLIGFIIISIVLIINLADIINALN